MQTAYYLGQMTNLMVSTESRIGGQEWNKKNPSKQKLVARTICRRLYKALLTTNHVVIQRSQFTYLRMQLILTIY